MSAVDTTIGSKPQGSLLPYRGSVVPSVTDLQGAIDAIYNNLNGADIFVGTAQASLAKARLPTSTTTISWDVTTANQFKANIVAASVGTAQLTNSGVTYAKIQNETGTTLLGNPTGSAAAPSEITLGATLAFVSTALQTVAMTGDVTASANTFATTIAANAVTNAKFRQGVGLSVVGVTGSATANVADIVGTANQFLGVNSGGTALAFETMSGDATLASGVITVAAAAITFAKIQNIAGLSVFGNSGTSAAAGGNITGTANQFLQVHSGASSLGFATLGGDATLSDGTLTIANNAVSNAKFRQGAGLSVVGVTGTATANEADIVGTSGQALRVNAGGTALAFGTIDLSSSNSVANQLQAASMPALTGATISAGATLATTSTIDLVFVIGTGQGVIATGITPYWSSQFDFAATIVQWSIVSDESGSISIDVLKTTYTNFDAGSTHPVSGDKISASVPITFSSATKAQSSSLGTWTTTSIAVGDILAFNVTSVTSCKQVVINIKVTKTS